MTNILRTYLKEKKVVLTDEQFNHWSSLFIPKKMKKGEFLLSEGEADKYLAFVVKGCLRLYTIDNKGKEHIMQFAPENWWISDMDSFSKKTPSVYFIDALEDSEVLLIDSPSYEKSLIKIPRITKKTSPPTLSHRASGRFLRWPRCWDRHTLWLSI